MSDPARELKEFTPNREFFIGIDSDGCVFDSMEIKQKECFCPAFVNVFGMQPVSKYARETLEFVNLYSKTRGVNRFIAVLRVLELLNKRPEVKARNVSIPPMQGLKDWVDRESKLGNPALEAELERNPDPDLKLAYKWSIEANEAISKIVHDIPPFPLVRECLEKMNTRADTVVVSQTPLEALEREWEENKIDGLVSIIAGQEMGTKAQHIEFAANTKYDREKILMIGDAPGDFKAAKANDALFFPVNPGHEEASWELFFEEALDRFFAGTYAGAYEEQLIKKFDTYLPEHPPWKEV